MDTTKLAVGQNVFMRSGLVGNWGVVVEVSPTGVIVQLEPCYGDVLFRFDRDGVACDSSDIGVDEYKDLVLFDYETGYLVPVPCDVAVDIERVKAVVSEYVEGTGIGNATCGGFRRKFRQRFWENFERLKKHSRYSKIPGHGNPWKLYLNWGSQEL